MMKNIKQRIEIMSVLHTATIRDALQAIDSGALGMAFLVDAQTQKFMGLVTDGDVRRALLKGYGLASPVSSVPRPEPKMAHIDMSLEEVAALFSDPVRVVPLLDDDAQVVDLAIFDRRMRLPVAEPILGEKELLYISECVLTGWVSSAGKFVTRFEETFAEFCNTRYAVATSNGTTA
ncbi:MAG: CBS domain-containing protein, partial [Planctomycetes bacterium]|nr:CBS domain-containing protein [Planctomycetota bacterium]